MDYRSSIGTRCEDDSLENEKGIGVAVRDTSFCTCIRSTIAFRRNLLGYDIVHHHFCAINISTFFVGRSFFFFPFGYRYGIVKFQSWFSIVHSVRSNGIFLAAVLQVINNMTRISVMYDDTLQDSCAKMMLMRIFVLLWFNRVMIN